jgi:hypothetical protein
MRLSFCNVSAHSRRYATCSRAVENQSDAHIVRLLLRVLGYDGSEDHNGSCWDRTVSLVDGLAGLFVILEDDFHSASNTLRKYAG